MQIQEAYGGTRKWQSTVEGNPFLVNLNDAMLGEFGITEFHMIFLKRIVFDPTSTAVYAVHIVI